MDTFSPVQIVHHFFSPERQELDGCSYVLGGSVRGAALTPASAPRCRVEDRAMVEPQTEEVFPDTAGVQMHV